MLDISLDTYASVTHTHTDARVPSLFYPSFWCSDPYCTPYYVVCLLINTLPFMRSSLTLGQPLCLGKPKIPKIAHGPIFLKKSASGRQFHEKSDPKSQNQASRSQFHSTIDSEIQSMMNKIKWNENHQISKKKWIIRSACNENHQAVLNAGNECRVD